MTAPAPSSFLGQWEVLAKLACWLRDERERTYPGLIARGKLDPAEAKMELIAIRAIAAEWTAIAARAPLPDDAPTCGRKWKIAMLEKVLANFDRAIDALTRSGQPAADHQQARAAVAALLTYQHAPIAPQQSQPA